MNSLIFVDIEFFHNFLTFLRIPVSQKIQDYNLEAVSSITRQILEFGIRNIRVFSKILNCFLKAYEKLKKIT